MRYLSILIFCASSVFALSQPNAYERSTSSSELYADLQKLQSPLRVLYIAAHPDDENSRLIASLSRDYQAHVTYLSLTRGSGGQNRIGTEQGHLLGALRTQELLSARRIDGARQEFTTAYDFGYSKTPEETLKQWDSVQLVTEITNHIRTLQPHLVITRFPTTGEGGHGHHTASAILAEVAFETASDPSFDSELPPWQPVRLLWNTWIPERVDPSDTADLISLAIDDFNPLDGLSTSHIAAHSRSQNRCQSFGTVYESGHYKTWFKVLAGKPAVYSIFDNCPTSWSALSGSLQQFDNQLQQLLSTFDFHDPSTTALKLAELKQSIALSSYRDQLLDSIQRFTLPHLFLQLAGVELSARARKPSYVVGSVDSVELHINNRTGLPLEFPASGLGGREVQYLQANTHNVVVKTHQFVSGRNTLSVPIHYQTKQAAVVWEVPVPIRFYNTHDVFGEQSHHVTIVPDVTADVNSIMYWTNMLPKTASVTLYNASQEKKTIDLAVDANWQVEPKSLEIGPADTVTFDVAVTPLVKGSFGALTLHESQSNNAVHRLQTVSYPHIEQQVVQTPASITLSQTGARISNKLIAYIHGVGDKIPDVLSQLGVHVTVLDPNTVTASMLSNYEVVVMGIRAYNSLTNIKHIHYMLLDFCDNGGTVIVQYATTRNLLYPYVGPYNLGVSWNRITEETAPLKVHLNQHEVFTYPNPISDKDFQDWVQERGLYFAEQERRGDYQDLVYGNDTGEEEVGGALMFTEYGSGIWVYTGLSFFRQLPAGVPGAIQLYMNILSL